MFLTWFLIFVGLLVAGLFFAGLFMIATINGFEPSPAFFVVCILMAQMGFIGSLVMVVLKLLGHVT